MTIINGIMEAFEEAAQTINVEEEDEDQDECPAELLISQEKLADLCAEVRRTVLLISNSPEIIPHRAITPITTPIHLSFSPPNHFL